jgi:hypothetical protein
VEEVAAQMDLADKTIKRDWGVARLWLQQRMKGFSKG